MGKFTGIAYEPHPVSPERKAELRAQGLKILDVRFKPEEEGEAAEPASKKAGRKSPALKPDSE